MKVISVIPARGGSQSIKFKNIVKVNSKPLIAYSIQQSLKSNLISRTIVSTDNIKIAQISKKFGAEVLFLRPKLISKNNSKDIGFFVHLINWLKKNENFEPDLIVQLRPTQPYRTVKLIDKAIKKIIKDKKADSLRSVSIPERTPFKMWLKQNNQLKYLFSNTKYEKKEYFNLDRRKLPEVYWHDGVIDIVRVNTVKKYNNLTGKKIIFIKTKNNYLIDIDSKSDLDLLNILIKNKFIKLDDC